MERFQQYLKIPLTDVIEKDGKILVEFQIDSIKFLWYYNMKEHKVSPMYLKKWDKQFVPIMLRRFSLTLTDEGRDFIKEFLLDPRSIIKKYSPEEYLLYIRK
jgi:hypothetical protein